MDHQQTIDHTNRADHNKANLNRIRRIQGQLNSLANIIEADEGTCEERVVRARAIEKGMTSLINHLVQCHVDNTARVLMETDPDKATEEISRLIKLLNK